MADVPSLLPPATTPLERAAEQAMARIGDVEIPLDQLWNPSTCRAEFLPWLAWGLSIDFWDADWTIAEKRTAIAGTLVQQMRKGTRTSLRAVLDRFDPLIGLVEWFQSNPQMTPHTARLELPLPDESAVVYDEALITALLRDIAQVKPVRVHMEAVHTLRAATEAWLEGGAMTASYARFNGVADTLIEPEWATYLQTELGEPLLGGAGEFLEVT